MIYGLLHPGSGLGNQLHRYLATRILAEEKDYEFSMVGDFKGKDFMRLDIGNNAKILNRHPWISIEDGGKIQVRENIPLWEEWNKNIYDPDFNFVEDNTIIDGNFEDPKYFEYRLHEIRKWLKTEVIEVPDDLCIIGFRGGEYYTVPELGLPKEYYDRAMDEMRKINPKMRFQVHTDDPQMAIQWFPGLECIQDIERNWQAVRWAKYAIIANSSFYVLPRLMYHHEDNQAMTIAPRYFNRYNVKRWEYPQSFYRQFKYI